jgi:hypothetical protein
LPRCADGNFPCATLRANFATLKTKSPAALRKNFCVCDPAFANHFALIRSFLIDSGHSQARATRLVQNIFAQPSRCTRSIRVAKFSALVIGKYRRAHREVKIG